MGRFNRSQSGCRAACNGQTSMIIHDSDGNMSLTISTNSVEVFPLGLRRNCTHIATGPNLRRVRLVIRRFMRSANVQSSGAYTWNVSCYELLYNV